MQEKRGLEMTRESQRTSFTFIYINVLTCCLSIGLYFYLPSCKQSSIAEINFLLCKGLNIQLAASESFMLTIIKRCSDN